MFPHYLGSEHQMLSWIICSKGNLYKTLKNIQHTLPMLFIFLRMSITKLVKE